MIVESYNIAEIVSTLPEGEERVMGVDLEAFAAITDSMANLYRNPPLAVVREYSTNARDAMIAAGRAEHPIEVILPSETDPQLTVTDTGIGMDKEQVLGFYSTYGSSDKRGTNLQAGTYGYGCKSGFAIASQFVVTSVKDGLRTIAVFYRNEAGIGIARLIDHSPTDEANGTTVKVPVRNWSQMEDTARRFFHSWPRGTVLVDGEEPISLLEDSLNFGQVSFRRGLAQDPNRSWRGVDHNGLYVVMGHTAYPVEDHRLTSKWAALARAAVVYVHAGIGEIDIIPSRESVRQSDKTAAFLAAQFETFQAGVFDHVTGLVSAEPSLYAAACTLKEWQPVLDGIGLKGKYVFWREQVVHLSVKLEGLRSMTNYIPQRGYRSRLVAETATVSAGQGGKVLVMTGVEGEHLNAEGDIVPEQRTPAKLADYCAEHGYQSVLLVHHLYQVQRTYEWFSHTLPFVHVIAYADYEQARREAAKANRVKAEPRPQVCYDAILDGEHTHRVPLSELKRPETVYWTRKSYRQVLCDLIAAEVDLADQVIILLAPAQREHSLPKRFAKVAPLDVLTESGVQAVVDGFTKRDRDMLAVLLLNQNWRHHQIFETLGPSLNHLADPELADVVRRSTRNSSYVNELWASYTAREHQRGVSRIFPNSGAWYRFNQELREAAERYDALLTVRYPLLLALENATLTGTSRKTPIEHAVLYVNTIYAYVSTVTEKEAS